MSFNISAEAYDRFMGRYSTPLAPQLADLAGVEEGQTALDVGCGPGALTAELAGRLGAGAISAVDPSDSFVNAVRLRHPGVSVHLAAAEQLPFGDGRFDVVLGQLVVHFMSDPVAGITEMARVTRPGGVVAACVWDHGGGGGPLNLFWEAARRLDPEVGDDSHLPGTRRGHLAELFMAAGLHAVGESVLSVKVEHPSFEEWWEPYTLGVGAVGDYMERLEPATRIRLRDLCEGMLPAPPFVISARAWAARGIV